MNSDVRILTTDKRVVPASYLCRQLVSMDTGAGFRITPLFGSETDWTEIDLRDRNGGWIVRVERELIRSGSLDPIDPVGLQPASAIQWVQNFLRAVNVVYSFRASARIATDTAAWLALGAMVESLYSAVSGVIQSDEGDFFVNGGAQIVWRAVSSAGERRVRKRLAILREGRWVPFEIDSGKSAHWEAAERGEIPGHARPL